MHQPPASPYFKSSSALFIDRPHLLTCHNVHERQAKLTLEALSLTYKCREGVGPRESATPVLSVNLMLQNAWRSSAAPIAFTRSPDSLSADSTHTHTHTHTHTRMKAIQSTLCTHERLSADMEIPSLEASQALSIRQEVKEEMVSSSKSTLPYYSHSLLGLEEPLVAAGVLRPR